MDDWMIHEPLDILVGYDRARGAIPAKFGAKKDRQVHRAWLPSDITKVLPDEATYWLSRAKRTAAHNENKAHRIAGHEIKRAKDDGYARRTVRHQIREGKIDMTQFDDTDAGRAEEALTTCVSVMRNSREDKHRLAAANTVLNFTKTKPVQKAEVTVKSAEAWLDELDEI